MGDFVHGFNKRVDNMYYKTYYNSDNGWFYTPITADLYDEEMKQKFPIYGSQVVDWEGNLMFFKWKVRK